MATWTVRWGKPAVPRTVPDVRTASGQSLPRCDCWGSAGRRSRSSATRTRIAGWLLLRVHQRLLCDAGLHAGHGVPRCLRDVRSVQAAGRAACYSDADCGPGEACKINDGCCSDPNCPMCDVCLQCGTCVPAEPAARQCSGLRPGMSCVSGVCEKAPVPACAGPTRTASAGSVSGPSLPLRAMCFAATSQASVTSATDVVLRNDDCAAGERVRSPTTAALPEGCFRHGLPGGVRAVRQCVPAAAARPTRIATMEPVHRRLLPQQRLRKVAKLLLREIDPTDTGCARCSWDTGSTASSASGSAAAAAALIAARSSRHRRVPESLPCSGAPLP